VKYLGYGGGLAATFLLGTMTPTAQKTDDNEISRQTSVDHEGSAGLRVYPLLDYPITLLSGVDWTWSPWVEVVPADTIEIDFEIVGIYLKGNDIEGIIELGVGNLGDERTILQLPSTYTAGTTGFSGPIFFPSIKLSARSRVVGRYTVGYGTQKRSKLRLIYREL